MMVYKSSRLNSIQIVEAGELPVERVNFCNAQLFHEGDDVTVDEVDIPALVVIQCPAHKRSIDDLQPGCGQNGPDHGSDLRRFQAIDKSQNKETPNKIATEFPLLHR